MSKKTIVIDFDGTIAHLDVGDELCERFAPPAWREIDERWLRREISLPDAQTQMWALTRATADDMIAHARAIGRLRDGVETLFAEARRRGDRVVIASGGFRFYIDALVAPFAHLIDDIYANDATFVGDRMTPAFCARGVSCNSCAVCKGRICALERARGATEVLFIGDGSSDRCVLACPSVEGPPPDRIAVVRGSRLHDECRAQGVACRPFDHFDELVPWL